MKTQLLVLIFFFSGWVHAEKFVFKDGTCLKDGKYGFNKNKVEECGLASWKSMAKKSLAGKSLRGGRFLGINLHQTDLSQANLSYSHIDSAYLVGANLTELQGERVSIRGAFVDRTDFSRANLSRSRLDGIKGHSTIFRDVDLTRASLKTVYCVNCDFSGAKLQGSNFSESLLLECKFAGATYDEKTILPFSDKKAAQLGMKKAIK